MSSTVAIARCRRLGETLSLKLGERNMSGGGRPRSARLRYVSGRGALTSGRLAPRKQVPAREGVTISAI